MAQLIIFTDLDGTLLDHDTYSYKEADEALEKIKEENIPLIICTSKTRAEIEEFREKLQNSHPFISENGGGIFIPKDYFDFGFDHDYEEGDYKVIMLGEKYEKLQTVVEQIKNQNIDIISFGDMTSEQVAKDSGLSLHQAELSKNREFDEVFTISEEMEEKVKKIAEEYKLKMTKGGRYYHLMGDSDKGKAVKILTALFRKKYSDVKTIGLGDSKNDFEMLDAVDKPFLVSKKDGSYSSEKYPKADGPGPVGWNKAVLKVISGD